MQRREPCVTVSKNQISFNAVMRDVAELDKNQYVCVFVDDEDRRIAFEFKSLKDSDDDFKMRTATRYPNFKCKELLKRDWILQVSEAKGKNIFEAKHKEGKWIITLKRE
ncbi:MAG: hypothetical protein LBE13_00655 [Bacteroidales bacterium]|nr:hypothetical protein [Bacteroidales bacterium]